MLWDDTTFDRWISGLETYTNRLTQITPLPSYLLREDSATITTAYRFWASEASTFAENRLEDIDKSIFTEHVSSFPNLRYITILSRSRLTYIDPSAYWTVWQTPRSRAWNSQTFQRHLLQPEPFKPSIGTTVPDSEGLRPLNIIIDTARIGPDTFKIGALVIKSIGGGQARISGSMNNSNRFQRKWHHDLHALTATKPSIASSGKIVLNLLIETQTEDLFHHDSLWMHYLDEILSVSQDTLEEITISNICYDWFWEHQQAHPREMLERCKILRRVNLEGGWCQNIAELLMYLHRVVGVREISINAVEIESVSWFEVLQTLRYSGTMFDHFEITASWCRADFYPWQADSTWAAPWSGESKDITSWLRNESTQFPLAQGPG